MESVILLVIGFLVASAVGVFIGAFVDWISEKRADAAIKKHDREVARKMRVQEMNLC